MTYRNRVLFALIQLKDGGTVDQVHSQLESLGLAATFLSTTFDYLLQLASEGVIDSLRVEGTKARIYRLKSREPVHIMELIPGWHEDEGNCNAGKPA